MTDEKQKLLYKLNDINEDAHGYAYETWVAADKLEEEADKLEEDSKNLTRYIFGVRTLIIILAIVGLILWFFL